MWMTLSLVTPSRSGSGAIAATSVLWVCMTPLGSPVVPEVNISNVTSFGSGRTVESSAGSRRSSHGVAMNDSQDGFGLAGLAVDHEHVLQGRPGRPEPVHHRRVIELRNSRGITRTLESANPTMNPTSRSR